MVSTYAKHFNEPDCPQGWGSSGKEFHFSLLQWWLFVGSFTWFVYWLDMTHLLKYASGHLQLFHGFKAMYRMYTSILFHSSLLHVLFNMLALVPLGSALERLMGSLCLCYVTILLTTSNAMFHLFISLLVAHNPFHPSEYFMNECAIGFSGILFSMIVIETSLSRVQSRSVFGLFNVPAQWYALILLVVFQILMTNVSLLGHLCGILSGFAYTYGFFNILIPGTSLFSRIESSSGLSTFVRRPKFILSTGGNNSGYIPTHTSQSPTSSGLLSGNLWRNFSSWIPQRNTSSQPAEGDGRFPGTGRTLGSTPSQTASAANPDSSLQARLLENTGEIARGQSIADGRRQTIDSTAAAATRVQSHQVQGSAEDIEQLVAIGFERTQVEVALTAADGDVNVAVEILMSQQVCNALFSQRWVNSLPYSGNINCMIIRPDCVESRAIPFRAILENVSDYRAHHAKCPVVIVKLPKEISPSN